MAVSVSANLSSFSSLTDSRHTHGMTIAAIAAELGMSESLVSKIEQQALAKLRALFSRHRVTIGRFPIPGVDAAADEAAPFDGVATPEIEA